MRIDDDSTGDVMYYSRHGTAEDKDEMWFNFTCGGDVSIVFITDLRELHRKLSKVTILLSTSMNV